MDFKEIMTAAKIPAALFVVVGIVGVVLGFLLTTFLSTIGGLIGMVLGVGIFLVECIILLWAGHRAAKKYQLDVVGSAGTGALAAFVGALINSIISFILSLVTTYLKLAPVVASSTVPGVGAAAALSTGAVALICGPIMVIIGAVIAAVIGAILGAIGGFLGQPKKK